MEILKKNSTLCFEFDIDHEVVPSEKPCKWGMRYRSVIGVGRASLIDDPESKRRAFDIIMKHYSGGEPGYSDTGIRNAFIIEVEIESMTGKESGY